MTEKEQWKSKAYASCSLDDSALTEKKHNNPLAKIKDIIHTKGIQHAKTFVCSPNSKCIFRSRSSTSLLLEVRAHNLGSRDGFQQCGILTSVGSDESVQPPFRLMFSQ